MVDNNIYNAEPENIVGFVLPNENVRITSNVRLPSNAGLYRNRVDDGLNF